MNKKELEEINKYCDPVSILIVSNKKRLLRLMCPFKVEVIKDVPGYLKGNIVEVEAVKIDHQFRLIYVIGGKNYLYSFFRILYSE